MRLPKLSALAICCCSFWLNHGFNFSKTPFVLQALSAQHDVVKFVDHIAQPLRGGKQRLPGD